MCASEEEIGQKISKYNIMLTTLINFVEYEDVEPGVGPVKRISKSVLFEPLLYDKKVVTTDFFPFIEH